jgi:hypothetical protein
MLSVPLFSLPRQAWDLAVDICLSQLPTIIEEGTAFRVSPLSGSQSGCGTQGSGALEIWFAHLGKKMQLT